MNSIVFVTIEDISQPDGSGIATRELVRAIGNVISGSLSVICPDPIDPLPDRLSAVVDRFEFLPAVTSPGDPRWHLREEWSILYQLSKVIASERPEAVITRMAPSTLFPAPLCRLVGVDHVLLVRGWVNRNTGEDRKKFHRFVERVVHANVRLSNEVFVAFDALREWLTEYRSGSQSPVTVLPNAVDPDLFEPADGKRVRRNIGLDVDSFVVGFVGAFAKRHMLPELIHATAATDEVRTVIVGDGLLRAELERLADDLGVSERVHFIGEVAHSKVPEYVNAFDVGYGPVSPDEVSNPIKCYEYLACGTPVITSRAPEMVFIEEIDAGVVLDVVEENTVGTAIETLRDTDAEEVRRMGRNGQDYVERNHTWSKVSEEILSSVNGV